MWRSHSRAVATTPSRQPVEQPETAQHEPAPPAVDDVEVRCGQQMRQRHDADLTGRRDQPHRGTGQRGDGVLSAVKDHPIREVQHTPPGQNRSPLPTGDGRAFCQRLGHVRRSSPTACSGYARRCSRPASRTATAPAASSPKPAPTPTSASSATTSPPASSSSPPCEPSSSSPPRYATTPKPAAGTPRSLATPASSAVSPGTSTDSLTAPHPAQ